MTTPQLIGHLRELAGHNKPTLMSQDTLSRTAQALEQAQDRISQLEQKLAFANKDLTRPECTNCGGSGWYQDSTEGGIDAPCHCWSNYADKLKARIAQLEYAMK